MAQSYLRQPTIERLPAVLEDLRSGAVRIPPFQRDFVWSLEQRIQLLDSVRAGLPTGSIMVWRTTRNQPLEGSCIGPIRIDTKEVAPGTTQSYLLDGRQRMTTLFAALAAGLWTAKSESFSPESLDVGTPDDTSWEILYDLDNEEFLCASDQEASVQLDSANEALNPEIPGLRSELLPMSLVLDDFGFDEWLTKNGKTRERYQRARALKSAFADYLIPIVPLATDDLGVVTRTFKRINSGGTPMDEMDMARALVWSPDFDLRSRIDAVLEELGTIGWGDLSHDVVLKVAASIGKMKPFELDMEILANMLKDNPLLISDAGKWIRLTCVSVLARVGIYGSSTLPYESALTFAVWAMKERSTQDAKSEAAIATWVAEVCIRERFGNAPPHMARAIWHDLSRRVGIPTPRGVSRQSATYARECRQFNMSWARSRVFGIALASAGPRGPNGDILAEPSRLLAQRSGAAIPQLIAPEGRDPLSVALLHNPAARKMLATPANRVLCPAEMLPDLRREFARPDCDPGLARSHLIDTTALIALRTGDLSLFFEARRSAIRSIEGEWLRKLGSRIGVSTGPKAYGS